MNSTADRYSHEDLVEMVKKVSKNRLHDLEFNVRYETPYIFEKVLNLMVTVSDEKDYKKKQPELNKILTIKVPDSHLQEDLLAYCNEVVELLEGRSNQLELALKIFYDETDSYLSQWKTIVDAETYSQIEKAVKTPKEELIKVVKQHIIEYISSRTQYYHQLNSCGLEKRYSPSEEQIRTTKGEADNSNDKLNGKPQIDFVTPLAI